MGMGAKQAMPGIRILSSLLGLNRRRCVLEKGLNIQTVMRYTLEGTWAHLKPYDKLAISDVFILLPWFGVSGTEVNQGGL